MLPCLSLRFRLTATLSLLLVAATVAPSLSRAASPDGVPVDGRGLPAWETHVWDDFPVRIRLQDGAAVIELLARVPIASFDRERIRRAADGTLVLEPRVTAAELRALEAAGYRPVRIPDLERAVREEMEAAWRAQAEAGGDRARAGERGVYHNYAQVEAILAQAAADHPGIAEVFSLGQSVQRRELWAIRISDNIATEEAEPEVRFVGSMHGNEPASQELLLFLVDWLTTGYGTDPAVTEIVDGYDVTIIPGMNPDGLAAGDRENAHNIDLNRNFPVPNGTIGDDGTWTQEPETNAVEAHGLANQFVVSANGHGGALVVNYPWDYTYALAPDNAAIILLSLEYSTWNLPMYFGPWPQGITNGAQWYVTRGCLQDWSYADTGCIDVTLELSSLHTPPASALDGLWDDNRESFRHYILAARYGLHGVVTDAVTGLPLDATVTVAGNSEPVSTDPDVGDWYKLLPTGVYDLTFEAEGYASQQLADVATTWGTPAAVDVALVPLVTGVVAATPRAAALTASPNPFRERTLVRYSVPAAPGATLVIHDVQGRVVRTLGRPGPAGSLAWDRGDDAGRRVAAGVYFVRSQGAEPELTRKLVVLD